MHAEIQRAELSRVLTAVARAVEPRSTIPILRNVVLTIDGDRLTARGTDIDVEVVATTPAESAAPGTACVAAHDIADIVKRMSGDIVTLDLEPGIADGTGILTVKCGRSRFKLPSIPSDSIPTLADATFDHEFITNLGALLAPVQFAISDADNRYVLMGAYLHAKDGKLRVAGCDGNCLSVYEVDAPLGVDDSMAGIIVPRRVCDLASSLKGDSTVRVGETRIAISGGGTTIYAKLIEGTYIDYMKALPPTRDQKVSVSKSDLISAIERANLISATLPGKAVRMHITSDGIRLVASDKDGRDSSEDVPATLEGAELKIAFASDYLRSILAAAPGDGVRIEIDTVSGRSVFLSESDPAFLGGLGAYRVAV